ncbi:hypothetical protein CJ20_022 [Escherichia phage CJ20]|nr:hypothetical protein CJ20_022 [Escherichia phage CJ20]
MPRLNKRQLKKARKKHINDIIENANVEIFVELLANQLKNLSKQEIDMNIENAKNVIETHKLIMFLLKLQPNTLPILLLKI